MKKKTVKYGLKHKKTNRILKYYTNSNRENHDCVDTTYTLTNPDYESSYEDWLVNSKILAGFVRANSTEWYNADYETPKHGFTEDELDVVKITIETEEEIIDIKMPTVKELFERKNKNKKIDGRYYEYVIGEIDRGVKIDYNYYDLIVYYPELNE